MLSNFSVKRLAETADNAIESSLTAVSALILPPRTEVGIVAAVTLIGVPRIAAAWSPFLKAKGISLTLMGVFCHAAPVVRFKGANPKKVGCELADLLIVADDNQSNTRRATLIQAKMASKAKRVHLSGSSSQNQMFLYQHWPSFVFSDTSYGTSAYALRTKGLNQSGTFGIIDRHFKNTTGSPPHWTQHPADPTPHIILDQPSLGLFLAEMLSGRKRGFGRLATRGGTDDWSQVVDRLLSVTFSRLSRSVGNPKQPRGVSAFALSHSALTASLQTIVRIEADREPPFWIADASLDDHPRGISILHINIKRG